MSSSRRGSKSMTGDGRARNLFPLTTRAAAALLADPATAAWSYFEMLTVMGWLVFGHIPDAWTIAGAAVVVLSGLYAWYRDRSDVTLAKP